MALELESERFPASGGTAADGVLNQLGRPNADGLTLLIREAVQNSWDARDGSQTVHFQADCYELPQQAKVAIAGEVFGNEAPDLEVNIGSFLKSSGSLRILALSDFGTLGLGGNTRADLVSEPGAPTHFVDLVRNLGRPSDREFSGGTYGFGKAAAFWASSLKTVAIYSRFKVGTEIKSRFIVTALGKQFTSSGANPRRCTGRHWWGVLAGDPEVAEPVEGSEADRLAGLFRGPVLRDPSQTGTTLFILAPTLSGLKEADAMDRVRQILRYYFWPKLVDGQNGLPTMSFGVGLGDVALEPINIEFDDELRLFVQAFRASQGADVQAAKVRNSETLRGTRRLLGKTAFVRGSSTPLENEPTSPDEEVDQLPEVTFDRPLRHIALMRQPHFVVRYELGQRMPLNVAEYAGVFVAESTLDPVFAKAEPPTHDDWVPDLLNDSADKSAVSIARRRIKEALAEVSSPEELEPPAYVAKALSEFSLMLGGLIPSVEPPGRRSRRGSSGEGGAGGSGGGGGGGAGGGSRRGGGTRSRVDLTIKGQRLELYKDQRALAITFAISAATGASCRVSALPKVRLLDGFEAEGPTGSRAPAVIEWTDQAGSTLAGAMNSCTIEARGNDFLVYVSVPEDAAVSIGLEVEEV